MEFIRTIRAKQQTQRQADIQKQAEEVIRVCDFDDMLYIAYNGTPLLPIEKEWTTKEIIDKLNVFRNSYIAGKMKDSRITAIL